ncbi:MAG TPA: GNAT family N-acetyltransferase [Steroidobacteraceae bacterium]|jgi:GNAT superfamily N-acetyltransferase|nr:GNAT family N-acetyltransferase [Steroidobacteraceae bacterium]
MWEIAEIRTTPSLELFSQLVDLLQDAVQSGASVGFLSPLSTAEARNFWMAVLEDVARGDRVVLLATENRNVVGCAQLLLSSRINARHRAEVQKLLVHSQHQKRGLGRALLQAIEKVAAQKGRSLVLADARVGGPGEQLFLHSGYTKVGAIPRYQRGPDGHFDSTAIFFRNLDSRATEM